MFASFSDTGRALRGVANEGFPVFERSFGWGGSEAGTVETEVAVVKGSIDERAVM